MKVAGTVTGVFDIKNVHGLLEEPPEQAAPVTVQPEKVQPEAGAAETEISSPMNSVQPLEQLGGGGVTVTEPLPLAEATFVVKV